ncbi:early nodulin-like protein 18 [Gastrolobium bilobum]|uniref:early nodulin-like protein 18 n=1 Tax=Gastrolobium bilobum TaxID=150636 RepID=UPI002AB24709|nr:early nodulin-like protein 18 [Gastrolobium bilobum]
MEQIRSSSHLLFSTLSCLLLLLLCFSGSVEAYKNYTVGDSLGWFDNLENPKVNYQKWVVNKEFSLGDFLIFNTDNNHSVVQTYNFTTYKQCDYEDAQDKDTIQWSASDPSNTQIHPVSVPVPLVKEGMTYFFSSDYDGEQCMNGQHFKINVTYGQGLPKSLKNSPEDAPSPASPVSGDDDSAPDTVVPANFSNPQGETGDDTTNKKSSSVSITMHGQLQNIIYGSLILLGIILLF